VEFCAVVDGVEDIVLESGHIWWNTMRSRSTYFAVVMSAAALVSATHAHAAVTISSGATTNMICSGGVCAPTATSAVLNVGDLETLLASGNVTVTTTGTGVQANVIAVKAALTWSNVGALSLLAKKSVTIFAPVSIAGLSGLTIQTGGKNGVFSFGPKGNVTFANLSSKLVVNGDAYTLIGNVKTLGGDIASNPNGDFALASNFDASGDGTYNAPPVKTVFTGSFTGLGNAISNLTIGGAIYISDNGYSGWLEGLFAEIGAKGTVENIGLVNANVATPSQLKYVNAGPLAGFAIGTVRSSYATGKLTLGKKSLGGGLAGDNFGIIADSYAVTGLAGDPEVVGGVVSENDGTITNSYAAGEIVANAGVAGGLAADNDGTVSGSYATGAITKKGRAGVVGGLVGRNEGGEIENSYATGSVIGGGGSEVGGLVGANGATIGFSYSTGTVKGGTGSTVGGLIGYDDGSSIDNYWDTGTSGQNQGAGNIANDPGITGLTTAQFHSGLPVGFDPKVWAEKTKIDDGFPYLLANRPGK